MENESSGIMSSKSIGLSRTVIFLASLLLADMGFGVILGILLTCAWKIMIPGDYFGVPILNTLILILSGMGIVGLVIGQQFLMHKLRVPFPSLKKRPRIICCLASSIVILFFVFVGAWILFPYLRYGVWLSVSEAFNVFVQVIMHMSPSNSPFWQDIIQGVVGGGTEQFNFGIWFIVVCSVIALAHYLFLESILEPEKTPRFGTGEKIPRKLEKPSNISVRKRKSNFH